ncbi:hypothetical protein H310_15398, partial [Aphanomyces invadans]
MSCFQLWGCRARTLQGRRLLANTVMLSLLWHVTAVTPVPDDMVRTWQSMLTRYILGSKTVPTARYRPLLAAPWQFDPKLGLGLPHIASKLRAQRLMLLQRTLSPATATTPLWQPLVLRQYARSIGKLYRAVHPFDFLLYHPHPSSKWLRLWELHPLWRDVWKQWSATPMDRRIQLPVTPATLLHMPVWLTQYAPTMANGKCAASVVTTPPTRRWCMYGVANGLHSLHGIVAVHGRWPTRQEFISMMSQDNRAARVELGSDGSMQWAPVYRAVMLYNHLTAVHQAIPQGHQDPPPTTPAAPMSRHPFYGLVKDTPQPFELWPRTMVLALAHHAPVADMPHPMASSARTTPADLRGYVRRVRRVCRQLPPLHGDVWMRVLFRMLPVNCRFAHLQVERPDAICCAYGCGH